GEARPHRQHEGEHAGHGQAQHPSPIGRDQPRKQAGESGRGDEGGRGEACERRKPGEENGAEKGQPHDPALLAQRVGAVADGNAECGGTGGDRGGKAQTDADCEAGQPDADGDRKAVFDMGAEYGQGNGTGKGAHLVWWGGATMLKTSAGDWRERRYYIPEGACAWFCPGRGVSRL